MASRKLAPIHPGEVLLADFLEPLALSQYRLALDITVPPRRINEIVHGKFAISDLPVGEHKVVIWQEVSGYVEKELTVTIKANATNDLKQIKAPLAKFKFAAEALK